jgi:hypothetical protein
VNAVYYAIFSCGCDTTTRSYKWGENPFDLGDEWTCQVHGEVTVVRTGGRGA